MTDLQPAPGWPALPIPQIPYGHIVATTIPDGADVYLDGQPVFDTVGRVATTPVTVLNISTGIHRVTFRKQGYFDEDVYVRVENGLYSDASAVLRLHMAVSDSMPPMPNSQSSISNLQPKQYGTVHFDTQPHGAQIIVDGQILIDPDTEESLRTPETVLLIEGRRDFTFRLEGHKEVSGYVDVFPGVRVDIFRNLEPIPGSNIKLSDSSSYQYPYYYGLGDIFVDSDPKGAYIYIDDIAQIDNKGNPVLTPATIIGVMQGLHMVQISSDGYYSKKIVINVISDRLNIAYVKLQSIYLGGTMQPNQLQPNQLQPNQLQPNQLQPNQLQPNQLQPNQLQPKEFGIVYFDSNPKGAYVYVDGQLLVDPDTEEPLRTPAKAILYEGRRDFTFTLERHEDASGYVDVLPGVTVNIYRNLKPGVSEEGWGEPQPQIWLSDSQQTPSIVGIGHIVADARPTGAEVYLDGQPVLDSSGQIAKAPTLILNVVEGIHNVTFRKEGYNDVTLTINVAEGLYSDANAILGTSQIMRYPKMLSMSYHDEYLYNQHNIYQNEVERMTSIKPLGIEKHSLQEGEVIGDVVITTYPAGGKIYLDGKLVVDTETKEPILTPTILAMYIGLHNLKFTLPGYCDVFDAVYVFPGQTQYVSNDFYVC